MCVEDDDYFFLSHVGFGMLAVSYLVQDAFYLRICIAISNVVLVVWGQLALPESSCISTMSWNGLFFCINVWRAWNLRKGSTTADAAVSSESQTKMTTTVELRS